MQPEVAIDVNSVVTRFGNQYVHRGITFQVHRGTVSAIIGGSGSGKSTLLKEIIRLLRPTSGAIKLFGKNVWDISPEEMATLRTRFGVLFQNGALFSALTVAENVAVPLLEQTSISRDMIDSIVQLRLALTGLDADTLRKMPSELSGGMRKRVALARALAMEPEMVFLDEPTSGLDPINARGFDRLIRALADNLGLTIVMVTHDLDTILSIVDHLIVLDNGELLAEGRPADIAKLDHPWIKSYFSARLH